MKRRKLNLPRVIEEIGFAKGTESMKASQMRPTTYKDKSKYNRKTKHKNHQNQDPGDFFMIL